MGTFRMRFNAPVARTVTPLRLGNGPECPEDVTQTFETKNTDANE